MYYLAIIQNETTTALYVYRDLDAALSAYHSELAYRSTDRTSTKCLLFDSELRRVNAETYTAPTNESNEG